MTTILKAHSDYTTRGFTKYDERNLPFVSVDVDKFNERVTTDFSFNDTDNKYVLAAWKMGAANGVGNGNFNPDGLLNREQAATMIVRAMQPLALFKHVSHGFNMSTDIGDLQTASTWAQHYMEQAYVQGLIAGTSKAVYTETSSARTYIQKANLSPKLNFTREQAIVILTRIMMDRIDDAAHAIPLRSYIPIGLTHLYADVHIDGSDDAIYIEDTGWDWDKAPGLERERLINNQYKDVLDKYTSMQRYAAYVGLPFDRGYGGPEWLDAIMGKHMVYDFYTHTVEKNKGDYLAIIRKNPEWDGVLLYRSYFDENGEKKEWSLHPYSVPTGTPLIGGPNF